LTDAALCGSTSGARRDAGFAPGPNSCRLSVAPRLPVWAPGLDQADRRRLAGLKLAQRCALLPGKAGDAVAITGMLACIVCQLTDPMQVSGLTQVSRPGRRRDASTVMRFRSTHRKHGQPSS
jgi:hypothetical protein